MEETRELSKILKETRRFDDKDNIIQKVCHLPDITENFLISLIKNCLGHIIPFVYESSLVLSKLADAGFETDPKKQDNTGKSALFYALKSQEPQLVFLLYDHVANNCLESDVSIRSPNSVVSNNLSSLKDYLESLKKELVSEGISKKSRSIFSDLLRFNQFQIEICGNIHQINKKYNGLEGKEFEASQRREIVLTILKTYESFFDSINGKSHVNASDIYCFKEYFEHKDYFEKLDFSLAFMFFDNLFLLKERLLLANTSYLNIESRFFLCLFCRNYIIDILCKSYENQERFYFVSRWITFQKRLSLQNQLCNFKNILEKTEPSENNIVDKIPDESVRTLINFPVIYGQFLVNRLQHYLKAATRIVVEDPKSILVIERSLQVIGECCKNSNFMSVQKILTTGLPSDFIANLKQIRNRFSHIKSYELQDKYYLKQDLELFKGIQSELVKLSELLSPIYSTHKYEMDKFLLSYFKEIVEKAQEIKNWKEHENELKTILPSLERKENQLSMPTDSCETRWKQTFKDVQTSLSDKIDVLDYKGDVLDQNTAIGYNNIVQNIIFAVEEKLKNQNDPPSKDDIDELDSHFWSLEQILTFFTTDQTLAKTEQAEKLRSVLKARRKVWENPVQSENTNTDGNSVVESNMAGNNPSLKPEEPNNNNQKAVNVIQSYKSYKKYAVSIKPLRSTSSNQTVDIGASDIRPESFRMNAVENEIIRENVENNVLQSTVSDSISEETTVADSLFNSGTERSSETMDVRKKEVSEKFLNNYKEIASLLFQNFSEDSRASFDFKNIKKYCWMLKGHKSLNKEEKERILQGVPEHLRNVSELKRRLIVLIAQNAELTTEISDELHNLNMKSKTSLRKVRHKIESGLTFEAIPIVCSVRDNFLDLQKKIHLAEIKNKDYEDLCQKLELSRDAKDLLGKIVKGKNKRNPCDRLKFLLESIRVLKNILIDENNGIQQLWKEPFTRRQKMLVKEKIVQLYLNDSAIQASVETLLFDCIAILDIYELDHLWRKTTNLLNGINLRNVLAHGHPLLESLGRLLDPCDLPSELVEKMLKLILDQPIIDCIQKLLEVILIE